MGTGGRWWSGGSWQAWEWEGLLSLPLMLKPLDCDGDDSDDDDNRGGDDETFGSLTRLLQEGGQEDWSLWLGLTQCSMSTLPAIQFRF